MNKETKENFEKVLSYYNLEIPKTLDLKSLKNSDKIDMVDIEGYKYNLSYSNLYCSYKREGMLARFFNKNIYTVDNIRNYIKLNNLNIKLLSKNISNAKDNNVEWECSEHKKIFLRSWNKVKNGDCNCDECSKILINQRDNKRRNSLEKIKKEAFKNYDIEITSTSYINNLTPLDFICNKHRERGVQSKTWGGIISSSSPCVYCSKENAIKK